MKVHGYDRVGGHQRGGLHDIESDPARAEDHDRLPDLHTRVVLDHTEARGDRAAE